MKTPCSAGLIALVVYAALAVSSAPAADPSTTSFSYQGRLIEKHLPAQGLYDFEFGLYDLEDGGEPVEKPFTVEMVPVSNGLFTVNLDFAVPFTGEPRWLGIQARAAGELDFTALAPRQFLSVVPLASYSHQAGTATVVPSTNLSGILPKNVLPTNLVFAGDSPTFDTVNVRQISGDGSGLSNLVPADGSVTRAKLASELVINYSTVASGVVSGITPLDKGRWTFTAFVDGRDDPTAVLAGPYCETNRANASALLLRRKVPPGMDPNEATNWASTTFRSRSHWVRLELLEYDQVFSSWVFTNLVCGNYSLRLANDGLPVEQIELHQPLGPGFVPCKRWKSAHNGRFTPQTTRDTAGFASGYDPRYFQYQIQLAGQPWTNGIIASDIVFPGDLERPDPFIVRQSALLWRTNPLLDLYDSGGRVLTRVGIVGSGEDSRWLFQERAVTGYLLKVGDDGLPYEELIVAPVSSP